MTDRDDERSRRGADDTLPPSDRHAGPRMAHPVVPKRPVRSPAVEVRPFIERRGMAAVAVTIGLLFAGVAVAAWFGGELFLAVMAAIGGFMTLWVGALTLVRG